MSEPDTPTEPAAPDPRTNRDVKAATAWLLANRDRYTEAALLDELRTSGYSEEEITAIRSEAQRLAPPPRVDETPYRDYRAIAAVILIVAFLGVWALVTIPWMLPPEGNTIGMAQLVGGILAFALGLIALPTLIVIIDSKRLRRGTIGALVAFLTVPFILLFIVAGVCVMTTGRPAA
jgi:hypothetical protein